MMPKVMIKAICIVMAALMILSVDDPVKANDIISETEEGNVDPTSIYRINK